VVDDEMLTQQLDIRALPLNPALNLNSAFESLFELLRKWEVDVQNAQSWSMNLQVPLRFHGVQPLALLVQPVPVNWGSVDLRPSFKRSGISVRHAIACFKAVKR
jgi:hypothetical protein